MSNIRTIVRSAYDCQKLRIQIGNRIVGDFKSRLGQEPSHSEEELGEKEQQILKVLRAHYRKITDGIKIFPRQGTFKGDELITDYTFLCLLAQYIELEDIEAKHFSRLGNILRDYPVYVEFLEPIKGIGAAMAGVIISEIDIHKAKYPSSLWAYAGLDCAPDGRGRSRRKEHLVQREYINAKGEEASRASITYNPFLKTKIMGVLAASFLRAGNEKYGEIYRSYKHRLENHLVYKDVSKGHRHNMALRKMVKEFLKDLYVAWRTLEGLPVAEPYEVAKLGHTPHQPRGERGVAVVNQTSKSGLASADIAETPKPKKRATRVKASKEK